VRIFIVEDDLKLAEHLKKQLERYQYEGHICQNFQAIATEFAQQEYHLVLLDVNLPYYDGFYWCQQIRTLSNLPIIFLSARDHPMDQVMAIENGADDYLTKPFSYEVLLAKVKGQLRRAFGEYQRLAKERTLCYQALTYLPERLEVQVNEQTTQLSRKEGDLLELLLAKAPKIVEREAILLKLWDDDQFVDDNTLSVNVTRLRKKLAALGLPDSIQTVRNTGYRLVLGEKV
jgi:DNA-binding response OmpR family regulator